MFKQEGILPAERLHPEAIVEGLHKAGHPAIFGADADAIVDAITPQLMSGDVVGILSNGGFGGIYEKLPERLRHR